MNKQDIQTVINAIETDLIGPRRKAIAILQAALAEPSEPAGTFQLYEGVYEHMADSYTGDDAVKLFTHPAIKLDDDRIADLENSFEIERLKAEKAFYKNRVELLHKWQSKMRDPERTLVCDILANGQIWHDESRYTPQTSKPEPSEPVGKILDEVEMQNTTLRDNVIWWNKPASGLIYTHPAPMPEPLTDEEIYALTTKLVKALDEIERLKPLAEVGRAMVEMTTTVHGADEWDVIPELWRMCMAERDIARADNKRKDAALRVALDALNHVAGKGKRCEAAITAINEALA